MAKMENDALIESQKGYELNISKLLDELNISLVQVLTAPIVAGNRLYGLLTVDSGKKGDLGEFDKSLLIHFASQMAITYTYESSQAFSIELNGHGSIENEYTTHQGTSHE